MVEWFNTNYGAVQGIATIVLVLITAISVALTLLMAGAARKQAESSGRIASSVMRPLIDIRRRDLIETPSDQLAIEAFATGDDLHVSCQLSNVGLGPALNITGLLWRGYGDVREENLGTLAPTPEPLNETLLVHDGFVILNYEDAHQEKYFSRRSVTPNLVPLGPLETGLAV